MPIGKRQIGDPTVVARVVFQTRDPEHLLELLREALTGIADPVPENVAILPTIAPRSDSDPWLKHPEAGEYLGISTSTIGRAMPGLAASESATAGVDLGGHGTHAGSRQ